MQQLNSILVVLDRRGNARHVLAKAMVLARHFHAKVERPWGPQPRFAAALDVSEQETPDLANAIARTSGYLAAGCQAELELLYCERSQESSGRIEREARLQAAGTEAHVPRDHIHLLNGEPEATLAGFAFTRHYDVMVLGALTHRKGMTDLVGTLTSALVDALDCDFVLVKSGAYSCPVNRPAAHAIAG